MCCEIKVLQKVLPDSNKLKYDFEDVVILTYIKMIK